MQQFMTMRRALLAGLTIACAIAACNSRLDTTMPGLLADGGIDPNADAGSSSVNDSGPSGTTDVDAGQLADGAPVPRRGRH